MVSHFENLAVLESDDEVARLEKRAEQLNEAMAEADEDTQAEIQSTRKSTFVVRIVCNFRNPS